MFVYVGVKVGPFLERANRFDVPNFDEEKLLNLGFVLDEYGNYVYEENDMKIIVWVIERKWCWSVCCSGMDKLIDWIVNAIRQYRNTKGKRGPSSWVDYVG